MLPSTRYCFVGNFAERFIHTNRYCVPELGCEISAFNDLIPSFLVVEVFRGAVTAYTKQGRTLNIILKSVYSRQFDPCTLLFAQIELDEETFGTVYHIIPFVAVYATFFASHYYAEYQRY